MFVGLWVGSPTAIFGEAIVERGALWWCLELFDGALKIGRGERKRGDARVCSL